MAKSQDSAKKKVRPASTPEAREAQLISLAEDQAEKLLREGKAPSSIVNHFLKLGSLKYQSELEKLRSENELLKAKTDAIQSQKELKELYTQAMDAMRRYQGSIFDDEEEP